MSPKLRLFDETSPPASYGWHKSNQPKKFNHSKFSGPLIKHTQREQENLSLSLSLSLPRTRSSTQPPTLTHTIHTSPPPLSLSSSVSLSLSCTHTRSLALSLSLARSLSHPPCSNREPHRFSTSTEHVRQQRSRLDNPQSRFPPPRENLHRTYDVGP